MNHLTDFDIVKALILKGKGHYEMALHTTKLNDIPLFIEFVQKEYPNVKITYTQVKNVWFQHSKDSLQAFYGNKKMSDDFWEWALKPAMITENKLQIVVS